MIAGEDLRNALLTPQMLQYFRRKFPQVPDGELEVRLEESLKFLNIAVFCRGNIPVSQEIDDIWHYWILQTREYARLCTRLQGNRFIHHSSNAYDDGTDAAGRHHDVEQDVVMLATYVLNYGPFEARRTRYWTFANHLLTDLGMSLDQLNDWLNSALARTA